MKYLNFLISELEKEKELVKDSLLVFAANGLGAIVLFIVNLVLARIFGPESFGNFRIVFYLLTFFPALIDFGAKITFTKYFAQFRVKNKEKIGYMTWWFLKLRLIIYLFLLIGLVIFAKPISQNFLHDSSLYPLIIFGLSLAVSVFFEVFPFAAMGYENFSLYLKSKIITNVGYIILGIGLGYFFGVGYALLGFGLSMLLGNLIPISFLFKKGMFERVDGEFDVKKIFFRFSLPMHLFKLPNALGNSIVPILSLFFSMNLIGQYSFSFLFYNAGLVIPGVFASVLLPKFSRLTTLKKDRKIKETLVKVFLGYTILVIGAVTGSLIFGDDIISIIAPQYLSGILFFKVLVSLGLVVGYLVIYQSYLTAKEKMKEIAILVLIQNILLFLFSFILLKMSV